MSKELNMKAAAFLQSQLGVREATGKNDGPAVKMYLKLVGLNEGYAWCMAFVYWGFAQAAKALGVQNPVPKTAGVLDCRNKAKAFIVVGDPEPGDQFIMEFGKGTGHTGMVIQKQGKSVLTIEGNTSADPKLAAEDREGNGVFLRLRPISSIKCFIRY